MTTTDYAGDRKRSRPVTKKSKFEFFKKNKLATIFIIFIIVIVAATGIYVVYFENNDTNSNDDDSIDYGLGGTVIDESNSIAVFDTTLGSFKIELYEDKLPETCNNFIRLVNDGFYNGMNFYRVLDNFMIQGGRYFPDDSQQQSPYGNINFEDSDVKHLDGSISMASTGDGVGGSAEFFICDGAQSGLDGRYAAFGKTIEGLEVVHSIAAQPNDGAHPAGGGKPYTDIVINSITIE